MQTQKRVFSKLFNGKVNLSKKVDLNVVLDLASISSAVNVWRKNIDIDIEELERLTQEIETVKISLEVDIQDLDNELKVLENKIIEAENAADSLGIDATAIDNYPFAKQTYEDGLTQLDKGKNNL
tara:strand:+ start:145 stop:519 length:375 start_codon:yes stop_codon:yes gene_type:complete